MLRSNETELTSLKCGRPVPNNLAIFNFPAAWFRGMATGLRWNNFHAPRPVLKAACFSSLILCVAQNDLAHAGTIKISPNVGVKESYTDNVRSVANGAEGDLITETRAGAKFLADGNRLDLNLDVTGINEQHLETSGLSGSRVEILGSTTVQPVPDHFFIDGRVSRSEINATRSGAISATNRSLPTNRTSLLLYEVAPRLEQRLGRWLEATLAYNHSESRFSKPSSGASAFGSGNDQKTNRYSLDIGSGKRFSVFNSKLNLSSDETKTGSFKQQNDRIDLLNEYQLTRQIGLIARGGYEDISDNDATLSTSGPTWALGTHLQPGPRLDFRIEAGRKYDAGNVSANLTYKIGAFYALNMSFTQAVQTQQQNRLDRLNRLAAGTDGNLIDPFTGLERDPGASSFDLNGGSFKEDLFQLGFTGNRGRNQMGMSVEYSSRESNAGTVNEDLLDINLDLSRKLQRSLTGTVSIGYSDVVSTDKIEGGDTRYNGTATLEHFVTGLNRSRIPKSDSF